MIPFGQKVTVIGDGNEPEADKVALEEALRPATNARGLRGEQQDTLADATQMHRP